MTRPHGRRMQMRNPVQERGPVEIEDTSQRSREETCDCKPPVYSGRMYLGTPHCILCGHLIVRKGTSK